MSDDLVEAIRRIMPDAVEIAPRVVTALAPLTVDKMGLPLPVIDALGVVSPGWVTRSSSRPRRRAYLVRW